MMRFGLRKKQMVNKQTRKYENLLFCISNTGKYFSDALISLSVDMIAAQLFLFYVAGFETSASTAAFTIYEMSQYPDILGKAVQDIEQAMEKHGGITYDSLKDMKYLDLCVKGNLSKHYVGCTSFLKL